VALSDVEQAVVDLLEPFGFRAGLGFIANNIRCLCISKNTVGDDLAAFVDGDRVKLCRWKDAVGGREFVFSWVYLSDPGSFGVIEEWAGG